MADEAKYYVNGGTRLAVTIIFAGIGAILLILASWVWANTENISATRQKVSNIEGKLDSIIENQKEFKGLLRRAAPYELRGTQ